MMRLVRPWELGVLGVQKSVTPWQAEVLVTQTVAAPRQTGG